jgi:hypothetical protein
LLVIIVGLAMTIIGGWATVSGAIGTFGTVKDAIDMAVDPTGNAIATTDVPGTMDAALEPGVYQLIAYGPNLTKSVLNPGGIVENEVVALPFTQPTVSVSGPQGDVDVGPPTVGQLVDTPSNDAVAFAEFTVAVAGDYRISTSGEGSDVRRVGLDARPDIVGQVTKSITDGVKLTLGIFAFVFGLIVLIVGLVWNGSAKRRPPPGTPSPWPPNPGGWQPPPPPRGDVPY